MRHLHLDFARSPMPRWPGLLCLAVGVACAVFGYEQYLAVSQRDAALEQEISRIDASARKSAGRPAAAQPASAEMEKDLLKARQRADFLLLPWNDLFASLEFAAMGQVALLAIEPDVKTRQVRLTAEARDEDALFEYLKRLDKAPQLQGVHLVRHEIREEDKRHPVRFTVLAFWKAGA